MTSGFSGRMVLASNNRKKYEELSALLRPLGIELIAQGELAIAESEEPFPTFVENALTKARHASRLSGLPALADDSGICVAALNGAPGVHSARYARQHGFASSSAGIDYDNNQCLLAQMAAIDNDGKRCAHYVCVLAFMRHPLDPQPLVVEGEWHGEILHQPRGQGGFGYDPLFLIPALGKSAAELPPAEKNARSHRGQAIQKLIKRFCV